MSYTLVCQVAVHSVFHIIHKCFQEYIASVILTSKHQECEFRYVTGPHCQSARSAFKDWVAAPLVPDLWNFLGSVSRMVGLCTSVVVWILPGTVLLMMHYIIRR